MLEFYDRHEIDVTAVDEALREQGTELAEKRQAAVRDGTWDARAEWVSDLIERKLKGKGAEGP